MAANGVGAAAGPAAMIQITEIHWIAEYRFRVRFSDDSVGGCDLRPLLGENISDNPQRDSANFATVLLLDGVPTWRNGFKVAPAQLRQHIDTAMCRTLLLDDTSDAILIGKSGEPVPASDLLAWLATNCRQLGTITMTECGTCIFDLRMRARQKISSAAGRRASALADRARVRPNNKRGIIARCTRLLARTRSHYAKRQCRALG